MAQSALYHTLFSKNKIGGQKRSLNDLIKLFNQKKDFLLKIFSNLIFQLIVTYIVATKAQGYDISKVNMNFWVFIIPAFILIFLMAVIQNPFIKFILFTMFSILFGLMLSYRFMITSPEVIKTALIGVLGIFITMFLFTLVLLMMGIEVGSTFGLFLLMGLIAMIIVLIVSHFMKNYSKYYKIFSGILLFLFSLYIIYDTTNILIRDFYKGDFISASLDYYLDIINIFVNLLNLSN
jgi:FtsH-binding integral membrane protein